MGIATEHETEWTKFEDFFPSTTEHIIVLWDSTGQRKPATARFREDCLIEELYSGKLWHPQICPYTHWIFVDPPEG